MKGEIRGRVEIRHLKRRTGKDVRKECSYLREKLAASRMEGEETQQNTRKNEIAQR